MIDIQSNTNRLLDLIDKSPDVGTSFFSFKENAHERFFLAC